MSYVHPAWVEHQRKRWMRPDAERYWRHDRERYFKPGVLDGKSAFERSRAEARDAAHELAFQDELLALRRDHAALRRAFAEVKAALLARKAGFDPDQPRVAAGNSDGGQWTDTQLPNALNSAGGSQRLYPQCIACSDFQGGWIRGNKGVR